jgi:hypothetical protein
MNRWVRWKIGIFGCLPQGLEPMPATCHERVSNTGSEKARCCDGIYVMPTAI